MQQNYTAILENQKGIWNTDKQVVQEPKALISYLVTLHVLIFVGLKSLQSVFTVFALFSAFVEVDFDLKKSISPLKYNFQCS